MSLTAKEILAVEDLPRECVLCPEWGGDGKVWVKALDAEGLATLQDMFSLNGGEKKNVMVLTVAATACDENGVNLFDFSPDTLAALRGKSAKVMVRLAMVANRLNSIEDATGVESPEKN